jgi:hypothetical protein
LSVIAACTLRPCSLKKPAARAREPRAGLVALVRSDLDISETRVVVLRDVQVVVPQAVTPA